MLTPIRHRSCHHELGTSRPRFKRGRSFRSMLIYVWDSFEVARYLIVALCLLERCIAIECELELGNADIESRQ